jgi:putative membrane protein
MMLMMRLFWGLVITVIVLALRWSVRQSRREQPDRALDILRGRYARGEIDEEEFDCKRRDPGGRALRAE